MRIPYKVLAEGRMIPWYLGKGYESLVMGYAYYYAIPIHLVIRLWHQLIMKCWTFVQFPPKDFWEEQLEDRYWDGYNAGAKVRDEHLDMIKNLLAQGRAAQATASPEKEA